MRPVQVYKALRNGVQPVAVKVIPARGDLRHAALPAGDGWGGGRGHKRARACGWVAAGGREGGGATSTSCSLW